MFLVVGKALRWYLSLGRKFAQVVFFPTFLITLLSLVSEVSLLLAMFMPLKVIMILGSGNLPGYFPAAWQDFGHEKVVFTLSLATLVFYLLYLALERLSARTTTAATIRLLQKSHKMQLFARQDDIARNGFTQFANVTAAATFVGCGMLAVLLVYPLMGVTFLLYVILAVLAVALLYVRWPAFRSRIQNTLPAVVEPLTGIGFFVVFGFLVVDFSFLNPPHVYVALVALLIFRRLLQKISAFIGGCASLYVQKPKLAAIFFHGQVFVQDKERKTEDFWSLISSPEREIWMQMLLHKFAGEKFALTSIRWRQSAQADIAFFELNTDGDSFLLKVFNANRRQLSLHETTLLLEGTDQNIPAPELLGAAELDGVICELFRWGREQELNRELRGEMVWQVRAACLAARLPKTLVEQYLRSKPLLQDRLDIKVWQRLYLAASTDTEKAMLQQLFDQLPRIQDVLHSLPLALQNTALGPESLFAFEEDGPRLLNWSGWTLEPVGCGWLVGEKDLDRLEQYLKTEGQREELRLVDVRKAKLAAHVAAFEGLCRGQRFQTAMASLPKLLEQLDVLEDGE